MSKRFFILFLLLAGLGFVSCRDDRDGEQAPGAMVVSVSIDGRRVSGGGTLSDLPLSGNTVQVTFSREIDIRELNPYMITFSGGDVEVSALEDGMSLQIVLPAPLKPLTTYRFSIIEGEHLGVRVIQTFRCNFSTGVSPEDKFPRIPTEELLTKVQEQTFRYFWDYAHPVSGLARERLGSGDTVTAGGSGFGIMALVAGVERGFITRVEGAERLRAILDFLAQADRFHGAFPHWMNGRTGRVIPFGTNDNGGDLVETAFLMQGLLAAAQYFDAPDEADIRSGIDALWREVEWDWYTRGGQDVLYWHWSPDRDWTMNMTVQGWNEGLIVYVLGASSPTHPISRDVYSKGWARSGGIRNGKKFYDITLPLGPDYGGPLFFAHYSFLGLNPRGLQDAYGSYWDQNVAHAKINHAYCAANPGKHSGYSDVCWGLTASDIPDGYTASSPTNDKGVIAPTAALASFPYTPEESLHALEYFYYVLGDRLWGEYGFYDAFCLDRGWFASSCLAIDQGPIVVMIENYRTGLLWDLFMCHPDVVSGLAALGFSVQNG